MHYPLSTVARKVVSSRWFLAPVLLLLLTLLISGAAEACWSGGQENLTPLGATRVGDTSVVFETSPVGRYRFLFSSDDSVEYTINLADISSGLLKINASVDGGETYISPTAFAGPLYRFAEGTIIWQGSFLEVGHSALVSHEQAGDAVILRFHDTFGEEVLERRYEVRLSGRTLVVHVASVGESAKTVFGYAGFHIGRSLNTPSPEEIIIPYMSDIPIALSKGRRNLFFSLYLDKVLSNATRIEKDSPETFGPDSIRVSTTALYEPDSDGHVLALNETMYVTVSQRVEDLFPNIAHEKSLYRDVLNTRVVWDLWNFDLFRSGVSRVWVSPGQGRAHVSGSARDLDDLGFEVLVEITKNGRRLWSRTIENGNTEEVSFDLMVDLVRADELAFNILALLPSPYNLTAFEAQIEFNGERFAASTDFSANQGERNWFYREVNRDEMRDLVFDGRTGRWQGTSDTAFLIAEGGSPGSGRRFRTAASLVRKLAVLGLKDVLLLYHQWQQAGFDNELPAHFPANDFTPDTSGSFGELLAAAREAGYLLALHENYLHMYPNSPLFEEAAIARHADLSFKGGWLNVTRGTQSYLIAPDKMLPFARDQSSRIARAYNPGAGFLDVLPSADPGTLNLADLNAANPQARSLRQMIASAKELFRQQQHLYQGPLLGEGGRDDHRFDSYYAGFVDGVEREIEGGAGAHVMPDFELTVVKPLMANHGMGLYDRFAGSFRGPFLPPKKIDPDSFDFDLYRATQIAFGHAGYFSDAGFDFEVTTDNQFLRTAIKEYYLMQQFQAQYLAAPVASIRYVSGDAMLTLSEALIEGIDFVDVRVVIQYANGLTVYVNHDGFIDVDADGQDDHTPLPWRVAPPEQEPLTLPPNGWLAINPGERFLAYSALIDGHRADFVRSPAYVFADGRGVVTDFGALQTAGIRYITRDGLLVQEEHSGNFVILQPAGSIQRSPAAASSPKGDVPVGIAVRPGGQQVLVVNSRGAGSSERNSLSLIDTATHEIVATLPVGQRPVEVAISSDGSTAAVTNFEGNSVTVVDLVGLTVRGEVAVGEGPHGVAITPDGSTAVVTNVLGGSLSIVDLDAAAQQGTLEIGGVPVGIALTADGSLAVVTDQAAAQVVLVALEPLGVLARLAVDEAPNAVTIAPSGQTAYVVSELGNSVSAVDLRDLTVTSSGQIINRPFGIALTPDGLQALVLNGGRGELHVLDLNALAVSRRIVLGGHLQRVAMAPGGGRAYVTDSATNEVASFELEAFASLPLPLFMSVVPDRITSTAPVVLTLRLHVPDIAEPLLAERLFLGPHELNARLVPFLNFASEALQGNRVEIGSASFSGFTLTSETNGVFEWLVSTPQGVARRWLAVAIP